MHYVSYIPENITPSTKCIIMLHGVWSDESDIFALREYFSKDVAIISLRWSFSLGMERYAWYPVDFSTGKPVYSTEDVELWYIEILSCIREVSEKYPIKSENIFLMGFSQGAIMSYYTLWKSPETIWGIIALSGRLLAEIDASHIQEEKYIGKRVFIGHGEFDSMIPFVASEYTQDFIKNLGITPDFHMYKSPHTITDAEMRDIARWLG